MTASRPATTSAWAATLVLAVTLSACGGGGGDGVAGTGPVGGATAGDTTKGDNGDGTYTAPEVRASPAVFVAHVLADTGDDTAVLNQVLTDPFLLDGTGQYLVNADVMESAELTSEDPQVVTYRIKPGIRWSDGQPWDCDDFYLAWFAGSGTAVLRGPDGQPVFDAAGKEQPYFEPVTTAGYERATGECVDDLTFVETYQAPYADWRGNYAGNVILPAHVLERETGIGDVTQLTADSPAPDLQRAAESWNTGFGGAAPETLPASGPYKIASWQPGISITLTRNEQWAANPGGPERIVFVGVPDGAAAVERLQRHELNVITPAADPMLATRLRALSAQGVVFRSVGGPDFLHLDLNVADRLFQDLAVRHALAQCIDRDRLVDELVRGVDPEAQPLGSLVLEPGDPGYEDLYRDTLTGNAQRAKQILESTGWTLGPDNVYARADQRLSFRISHTGSVHQTRVVELIRTQCKAAGMEIIDAPDPAFGERLGRGALEAVLITTQRAPQPSSLASLYQTDGERNFQGYSNPEVDAAFEVVKVEDDQATRDAALMTAGQLLAADSASLPLFQVPQMWAYSERIDGVCSHGSAGVTWNANEWEIS